MNAQVINTVGMMALLVSFALSRREETIGSYERIRLLFGDDADAKQRISLLAKMRELSDEDLLSWVRAYAPNPAPAIRGEVQ